MDENEYYYDYEDEYNPISFVRQSSYSLVKNSDLETLRKQLIAECEEFTCLSTEQATILLIQFQWNLERIKDQWYEDVGGNLERYGLELSPESSKYLKRLNLTQNNSNCLICYTPKDNSFFSMKCSHNFCGDCWKYYLENKLEDILTCIYSTCPQQGCSLIVPEILFYKFIEKDKHSLFTKLIFKNFTDNNVDIKWCPTPECGNCIRSLTHSMKEITCECKTVFCFCCSKEGHRPCTCALVEAWDRKNSSESENVLWLKHNTKQCPACHKFIEKNQGCNHMTCRKEAGGCGYQFCWICLGEWGPHGTSYYDCNRFDSEKIKKEKNKKEAKFELERYFWHFNRYVTHNKTMKACINMRPIIQNEIKRFYEYKNIPYDELHFLEDAIETVIVSMRTLKNTYIFGYYMQDVKERKLFEHNQFLLEKDTDRLLEMMENNKKKNLLEIPYFDSFTFEWNSFKANVTNLLTATNKYRENLLTEIENNMMDFIDYKQLLKK